MPFRLPPSPSSANTILAVLSHGDTLLSVLVGIISLVTKKTIARLLLGLRSVLFQGTGGALLAPLAIHSPLATAIVATVVLLAFGGNLPGLIIGLALAIAVWLIETIGTIAYSPESLAKRAEQNMVSAYLLSIGIGAIYAHRADTLVWLEWVTLGFLGLVGLLVSAQPRLLTVKPITGANLPVAPIERSFPRIQIKGLQRIIWATVLVVGAAATIAEPATPWITLALVILTGALIGWNVGSAWLYAEHCRWRPLRALKQTAPIAMMPYGGGAVFHITMWEPYVALVDGRYIIVTLRPQTVDRLANTTSAPILCPAEYSEEEVNSLIPSTVQIAYYVHNSSYNSLFMANKQVSHVFVHHGDSDKSTSFNPRSANYDYLFVAGHAAIDRYTNNNVEIPEKKFRIIGKPQNELIIVDRQPISEKHTPTVLYAPTWPGKSAADNYSSLHMGTDIITRLLTRNVTVIFRPHPASKFSQEHRVIISEIQKLLTEDRNRTGTPHAWGDSVEDNWSVDEAINASDAMIADVSGIVTEFMQSGKPYAMVSPKHYTAELREFSPTAEAAYVIDPSSGSIEMALDDMLGEDPLASKRWERRSYFLGGFEGRESVQRFLDESCKLIEYTNSGAV